MSEAFSLVGVDAVAESTEGDHLWLAPVSAVDLRSLVHQKVKCVTSASAVWFLASAVDDADFLARAAAVGMQVSLDLEVPLRQLGWRSLSRSMRRLVARYVSQGVQQVITPMTEAALDTTVTLATAGVLGKEIPESGLVMYLLKTQQMSLPPRPPRDFFSLGGGFRTREGFNLSRLIIERRDAIVQSLGSTKTVVDLLATVAFSEDSAIIGKVAETVNSVLDQGQDSEDPTTTVIQNFRAHARCALQCLAQESARLDVLDKVKLDPTSLLLDSLATCKTQRWKGVVSATFRRWMDEVAQLTEGTLQEAMKAIATERHIRLEEAPDANRMVKAVIETSEVWLKGGESESDEQVFTRLVADFFGGVSDLRACLLGVEAFPITADELNASVVEPLLASVAAGDFRSAVYHLSCWRLCSSGGWLAADSDEHADKEDLVALIDRKRELLVTDAQDFSAARMATGLGMSGELFGRAAGEVESEISSMKNTLLVRTTRAKYVELRMTVAAFVNDIVRPLNFWPRVLESGGKVCARPGLEFRTRIRRLCRSVASLFVCCFAFCETSEELESLDLAT
jgi:hypothetical protein